MTLRKVLHHFETKTKLAAALKVTKAAVSNWPMDADIPQVHALRLKYEILPHVFGPNAEKNEDAA